MPPSPRGSRRAASAGVVTLMHRPRHARRRLGRSRDVINAPPSPRGLVAPPRRARKPRRPRAVRRPRRHAGRPLDWHRELLQPYLG